MKFSWQGRNKTGKVGYFPESYVEVGSTANNFANQITAGSSHTDGHHQLDGSPSSVSSLAQALSASTAKKYGKFLFLDVLSSLKISNIY